MSRSRLFIAFAVLVGFTVGIGSYTFVYARGYSYLSNNPAACANCHVMRDHYRAWTHGSHRAVAVCHDCHTPPGTIPKYVSKAQNGFWHSFDFTTGRYPDPLRITPRNHAVTEITCRKCHTARSVPPGLHRSGELDGLRGPAGGTDRLVAAFCGMLR